jgi:hypothetical protein
MYSKKSNRLKKLYGKGLPEDLISLAKGKLSSKPRFEGENHATQIATDGSVKLGEYIGPGTKIIERVKLLNEGNQSVKPVSITDSVALIHDIDYQLAQDSKTKQEQLRKVRQADLDMLKRLKMIKNKKLDKSANILLGEKGIGAKVGIEKKGKTAGTIAGLLTGGPAGAMVGRFLGSKAEGKFKEIAGPLLSLDSNTKNNLLNQKSKTINNLENIGVGSGLLKKIKNNEL